MVTNGSRISDEWLDKLNGSLDWAALSVDSVDPNTLSRVGRTVRSGPMSADDYLRAIDVLKQHGIRAKVNTVITRFNLGEDLTDFILEVRPERWKIFQVLPVVGQNDLKVGKFKITDNEFDRYVRRSRRAEKHGVRVVPENNDQMTGSYVMVDPAGSHTYSRHIIEVGVDEALREVSVDAAKFLSRDGLYEW